MSVAFHLVKCWELRLDWDENGGHWSAEPSELKDDLDYKLYYTMWSHILVMFVVPFGTFLFLNLRIIRAVHRARKARIRMSRSQMKEQQVTLMILAVIAFFILANSLPFVLAVLDAVTFVNKASSRLNYILVGRSTFRPFPSPPH